MNKMTADEILYFKKALAQAIQNDPTLDVPRLNDITRRLVQGLRTSERLSNEIEIKKHTTCTCDGCMSQLKLLKRIRDVPLPD